MDMNRTRLLFLLGLWLLSCNLPISPSYTEEPTLTPAPPPSPTPASLPGMVVYGRVTVNGVGLAGVEIYQNFAAYPASLIAITDENGYYVSDFVGIPGDEMIGLEPKLEGYTFDPPYYSWRHYHGYIGYTKDFSAILMP